MGILSGLKSAISNVAKAVVAAPKAVVKAVTAAPKAAFTATQNLVTKAVPTETRKAVVNATTTALAVLTSPIKSIQNLPAAKEKVEKSSTAELVAKGALNAALVVAPASSAVRSAVVAVIPASTSGKIIAAVAAPVAISAIAANPLNAGKIAVNTGEGLLNVGTNLGEAVANPSLENFKDIITENPVITGLALGAGALVAAKTIIPAVTSMRQTEAIQEQTEAIKGTTENLGLPPANTISSPTANTSATQPITAGTRQVTTTSSTTARKRRKKAKVSPQNISQRVTLNFDNDKIDNKKVFKGGRH